MNEPQAWTTIIKPKDKLWSVMLLTIDEISFNERVFGESASFE